MELIKHRAYKFAMNPTDTQMVLLNKHCGCSRFIYNTLKRKTRSLFK